MLPADVVVVVVVVLLGRDGLCVCLKTYHAIMSGISSSSNFELLQQINNNNNLNFGYKN
ncbi:hypothetical protein OAV88_00470 [bacterium]|nr:hypothetical protein [bacterium]